MAVTSDIVRTYRAPREVVRGLLAAGVREDRAFVFLIVGCILIFVAQLPRLSRLAFEQDIEFGILVANSVMGILIIWPLFLYLIAGMLLLVTRLKGGALTAYQARLALFWAFLAAAPLGLLHGLTVAFVGPGLQANLVGAVWFGCLIWFTWAGLQAGRDS